MSKETPCSDCFVSSQDCEQYHRESDDESFPCTGKWTDEEIAIFAREGFAWLQRFREIHNEGTGNTGNGGNRPQA